MKNNEILSDRSTNLDIVTLQKELLKAQETIESYQRTIMDVADENTQIIRVFIHDLANPLQIISMSLEMLIDNSPPEKRSMLQMMKNSADKMAEIITALRMSQLNNKQLKQNI